MMIPDDLITSYPARPKLESLANDKGILIGCASHVLSHFGPESSLKVLRDFGASFPAIEFSSPLSQLPELTFVHSVERVRSSRPVWRIAICDLETEKAYFDREPWFHFARALKSNFTRTALTLSLERVSEYSAKQMDLLLEVREALFPLPCYFEFEHHSWSRAEPILRGAKAYVVQHDSPELPGIIKSIPVPGKRALLRLLGRNKRTWFEHHPNERFAYEYSETELSSIAGRIRTLREESDSVTIIVATHPAPSALATARTLATLLAK